MKTVIDLVDDTYSLLDVPEVYSAMASGDIFLDSKPDGYTGECIVINSLPVTGDQLQKAVVNVNIYAPNLKLAINGQPDNSQPNRKRLKAIADVVIPILTDAIINNTVTRVQNVTMIREPELNEHFINIRVETNSINI
jgi:hypothetical protein